MEVQVCVPDCVVEWGVCMLKGKGQFLVLYLDKLYFKVTAIMYHAPLVIRL